MKSDSSTFDRLGRGAAVGALLVAAILTACSGNRREDPILRLAAAEALEQGKAMLETGKYYKARRLLTHAFEVEPNSRLGREALLLAADAFYLHGGPDNFVKCEAKYRDFLNRFPTSERADYAQFQVANCLFRRMEKPDRDQKVSHQAIAAYEELIRLYPTSEHTEEARQQIEAARNNLAAAELIIGRFYYRYGRCTAAIQRLVVIDEQYPGFAEMEEALFWLAISHLRCAEHDKAEAIRERLERDYPGSPWIAEYDNREPKVLEQVAKDKKKQEQRMQEFEKRSQRSKSS